MAGPARVHRGKGTLIRPDVVLVHPPSKEEELDAAGFDSSSWWARAGAGAAGSSDTSADIPVTFAEKSTTENVPLIALKLDHAFPEAVPTMTVDAAIAALIPGSSSTTHPAGEPPPHDLPMAASNDGLCTIFPKMCS